MARSSGDGKQMDGDQLDSLTGLLPGPATAGHETLAERVYRELRHFLMEGGAEPGQKLTLRQLTKVFGTSPMPVRAAVQRLAAEGALEALPNRAICVPRMTRARLLEMRRIRIALESIAIEEAVTRATDADITALEAQQADFLADVSQKRSDGRDLFRANKEFHLALYRLAGMPVLLGMIENSWAQVGPVLHASFGSAASAATWSTAPACHEKILEGMRRRDVAATRDALVEDVAMAFSVIMSTGQLAD